MPPKEDVGQGDAEKGRSTSGEAGPSNVGSAVKVQARHRVLDLLRRGKNRRTPQQEGPAIPRGRASSQSGATLLAVLPPTQDAPRRSARKSKRTGQGLSPVPFTVRSQEPTVLPKDEPFVPFNLEKPLLAGPSGEPSVYSFSSNDSEKFAVAPKRSDTRPGSGASGSPLRPSSQRGSARSVSSVNSVSVGSFQVSPDGGSGYDNSSCRDRGLVARRSSSAIGSHLPRPAGPASSDSVLATGESSVEEEDSSERVLIPEQSATKRLERKAAVVKPSTRSQARERRREVSPSGAWLGSKLPSKAVAKREVSPSGAWLGSKLPTRTIAPRERVESPLSRSALSTPADSQPTDQAGPSTLPRPVLRLDTRSGTGAEQDSGPSLEGQYQAKQDSQFPSNPSNPTTPLRRGQKADPSRAARGEKINRGQDEG